MQDGRQKLIDNFNPRSRAGSDLRALSALSDKRNFNPRSRAGSD